MTDIVERLRNSVRPEYATTVIVSDALNEAADEIERLRTQLAVQFGMHPGGDLTKAVQARVKQLQAAQDKAWTEHLLEREELKYEIKRLTSENIDRLLQKTELEDEIQRLRSSPTITETDELIARLRQGAGHEPADVMEAERLMDEAAEALHRLARNQISASHTTIAQAAAIQAQRADSLEKKATQMTEALLRAMSLMDELLRENSRLCAASDTPPDVKLFAAKSSFDQAMHKLLSNQSG